MGASTTKPERKIIKELKTVCAFDEGDIEEWYRQFKSRCSKENPDSLSLSDFVSVYNEVYRGCAGNFAEHVFRTFDRDRNGRVDFREFIIGLSVTETTDFRKQLRWAFDMYDIDGDGFISKNEMKDILLAWFRMTGVVPANKDESPENLTESMFKKIDLNRDSLISWEEFSHGVQSDGFLVNLLQCHPNIGRQNSRD